ncbi:MAG: ABC transporter permease subunit [Pirellulales bacterium]|nr:ABC transporter permease subunit [Pirellulales bacterium]
MSYRNVRLIFSREVRDQLRDRRTMFMIVVLPILLYPLLGMSFFQVSQFVRGQATRVLVIGARDLPSEPPLIDNRRFAAQWFSDPTQARLLELHFSPRELQGTAATSAEHDESISEADAAKLIRDSAYHVVVYFPPDFGERLEAYRQSLRDRPAAPESNPVAGQHAPVPRPIVFHNSAREESQIAYVRVSEVLERWISDIGRTNLLASGVDPAAATPVDVDRRDVAEQGHKDAAVWSKVLPFVVLLWALTGAFYPAVDLCAGEKERGTMETLLCSPADRTEIVFGKLLTIMLFSIMTVVLNVISVAITGYFVLRELPEVSWPPLLTPVWLLLVLIPVSALFSALCLALAAFARSSKEGQYYLMPVLMIAMPLVMLPLAPGVELTLGNSLIPITGLVLLLQVLLEGDYARAVPYLAPVTLITLGGCLASIRWAVDQFNSEKVLFRESERLDLALWLRQMLRQREATPSPAMAVFCGVLILLVQFFLSLSLKVGEKASFNDFVMLALGTQLVVILTPTLLMTIMLTRSAVQTLQLRLPTWRTVGAALGLVVTLHPLFNYLKILVLRLYPIDDEILRQMDRLLAQPPSLWQAILVVACVPAICEELAFRGFILTGLRHLGHKWQAIAIASFFFAITHAILQQSLVAFALGLLLGYLAVQTGSILPSIVFHMSHNALVLITAQLTPQFVEDNPAAGWLVAHAADGTMLYHWPIVLAGVLVAATILIWLSGHKHPRLPEESLCEAMGSPPAGSLAG